MPSCIKPTMPIGKHKKGPFPLLLALLVALGLSLQRAGPTTTPKPSDGGSSGSESGESGGTDAESLRLGYFPNVTHAPAIVGVEDGIFAEQLGDT